MEDLSKAMDELVSQTNELVSLKDSIQFNRVTDSDKERIMSKVEALKERVKEVEEFGYTDADMLTAIHGAKDAIYTISNMIKL